jgi:acetylornithine deacetylase
MSGQTFEPVELAHKLISFPTISSESNLDLIKFVADYLDGWGIGSVLFLNPEKTKANLLATIGPDDAPAIVLSGHTDVVPVAGQDWSRDPFGPWIEDDRLYGRGSADMKSFIAAVLALVPEMVNRKLTQPLMIALSFDEEIGCSGVVSMVEHIARMSTRPQLCIVGEPTSMKVIDAHKGMQSYKTSVHGRSAHSSTPEAGANAIVAAAKLIGHIDHLSKKVIEEGPVDYRFMPPYTTFGVGQINGGNALNIIAEHAEFTWEFRTLPGADAAKILEEFRGFAKEVVLPELKKRAPEAKIETVEIAKAPAITANQGEDAELFIKRLAKVNATGAVSYATDGGHFQETAEIPVFICGPGDIAQAHKPDEFIALSQIESSDQFLRRLLDMVSER